MDIQNKVRRENKILDDSSVHFADYIYPEVIKPIINVAEKKIDPKFKEATGFCRYLPEEVYKNQLADIYEEKRDWLKKAYFSNSMMKSGKPLLDMHKIAAVICRSVLKLKPFAFDLGKANSYNVKFNKNKDLDWLIENYLINYKVAVDIALGITLYDIIDKLGNTEFDNNPQENKKMLRAILSDIAPNGLDCYKSFDYDMHNAHESFYKSLIINLMINDVNQRDFDYLGFATNCFQLQQYTVLKVYSKQKSNT